jgi:hypothetical protein
MFGCLGTVLLGFGVVLYPAFAQARDRARTQVEIHRAFQVNLAMMSYQVGNDDRFPDMAHVADALRPYLHDEQTLAGLSQYEWNVDLSFKPFKKIKNLDHIWVLRTKSPDAFGKYVMCTQNSTRTVEPSLRANFEQKPILTP